jgi:hypothetical protein
MSSARPQRYRNLTLGLLGLLLIPAFVRPIFPRAGFIAPLLFVGLITRSLATRGGPRRFRPLLATAMLAVALRALGAMTLIVNVPWEIDAGLRLLTAAGFTGLALELLREVLEPGVVDTDRLYAAVSTYLAFGLLFASLYEAVAFWDPAAFKPAIGHAGDTDVLFYFSLVTLSTVGYGDIVPASSQTHALAACEAILGQLYLAIMMARLVGLHLNQPSHPAVLDAAPAEREPRAREPR